jgi:Holliday junction resolvasome RuvABC DNA-binding subunit
MEEEKTLLQQIREKEQEHEVKVRAVRAETEAAVAAAREEAEGMLCTADGVGKKEAEQIYWEEKAKSEAEIEQLKERAAHQREDAAARGERHLPRAVEKIVALVTMQ